MNFEVDAVGCVVHAQGRGRDARVVRDVAQQLARGREQHGPHFGRHFDRARRALPDACRHAVALQVRFASHSSAVSKSRS